MMTFPDNTVLIDSDGMPWRSYYGRFKSVWSCENYFTLATRLDQPEMTIKEFGITASDMVILNYGPWRILLGDFLQDFDLDSAVMEVLTSES